MKKKQRVLLLFLLTLILMMSTKAAHSLIASPMSVNQDTFIEEVGNVEIMVEDTGENLSNIVTDTVNPYEVKIKNITTESVFLRAMIQPTIITSRGVYLEAKVGKQLVADGDLAVSWTEGEDGYFYLTNKVKGNETQILYNSWRLNSTEIDETYEDAKLILVVKVEAINTVANSYLDAWWQGIQPTNAQPNLQSIDGILTSLIDP
ncbi:hypothetical protein I6N95_03825 [Vagococcus sp. BWB3-3]|uniref:Uncharacterized protein n=1 Tax=Vagococcus allomyrinae TaxID=2794353 RepID=A0A940P801_9ENTE|nr:hypothetical protein [Vagococcus allomyrinae]MBP1040134.1 hypothetical protein [Vagococcus allomyrinae]